MTTSYDAVVLAGGAARRLGGADKPALPVGGRMLLDRVLAACAVADSTVVVGPRRPTVRPVRWAREEPAGGGPVPALAAGLAALAAGGRGGRSGQDRSLPRAPDVVVVLAADLPFLTASTVAALVEAAATALTTSTAPAPPPASTARTASSPLAGSVPSASADGRADGDAADGAVLVDAGGRDQPLAAAYRVESLRRELALLAGEHGGLGGLPLRLLTGELALRRMVDPTGEASFDCDTWEDVAAARARLEGRSEG
jgi:molybdopterin-guanine dinucleotide biosynthesis protein A